MRVGYPILIQDYEEMDICLRAAADMGVVANLITPAASAWFAGPLYWQSMLEDAQVEHAGVSFRLIVDCGEDAGLVMQSLSTGLQYILWGGEMEMQGKLVEMARHYEAHLVEIIGEGLDLAAAEDKEAAAGAWLGEHATP